MKILRHKKFAKSFKKLSTRKQEKVKKALYKFKENPFHEILNNHGLHGKYSGKRSISVGGDLRIIFEEKDEYLLVIMIEVGTHAQLY